MYSVDTVETGKGPSPGKDKSYESSVAIFNIIYLGGASPQGDRFLRIVTFRWGNLCTKGHFTVGEGVFF